jgi:hypothetical protein
VGNYCFWQTHYVYQYWKRQTIFEKTLRFTVQIQAGNILSNIFWATFSELANYVPRRFTNARPPEYSRLVSWLKFDSKAFSQLSKSHRCPSTGYKKSRRPTWTSKGELLRKPAEHLAVIDGKETGLVLKSASPWYSIGTRDNSWNLRTRYIEGKTYESYQIFYKARRKVGVSFILISTVSLWSCFALFLCVGCTSTCGQRIRLNMLRSVNYLFAA